jgi:hypothetical protein
VGLAVLAAVPGCGGCRKDTAQAKKEREKKLAEERAKKKEEPKPDFEVGRLMARPTSRLPAGRSEPLGALYKPGHWTAATLEAKANNFDFVGDLEIVVTDGKGAPIPLQGMPFDLTTSSQVTLGKRQRPKPFESVLFVPPTHPLPIGSCRLNWRNGGRRAWQGPNLLSRMPAYQYHLVVIASLPENYAYLKSLASVRPPTDEFGNNPTKPYYNVALIGAEKPDPQRRLPLPSYGLWWTGIAGVLWDDAAPDALDQPQQQALLDWLHWGGQLILSGPGTLDKLSGSFLAPYLPAAAAPGARQLSEGDFEALQKWSGKSARSLAPPKDWTGVKLQLHPEAQFMPGSGGLLVERRVGRGRIVVSAFALSGRTLRSWPLMDEVLDAFFLRRPPRKFTQSNSGEWEVDWADNHHRHDAGCISNLRYFSRDMCKLSPDGKNVGFGTYLPDATSGDPYSRKTDGDLSSPGASSEGPGVAAWNDFNPVANSARTTLQNAAEIEIPKRSFVVWMVAGYLLVLVPANWAVFRLINRVEWAWAAAPAIAVACTIVVVRMAQLDIGFARSRTEIAVVELQGDYPRAHVTRYTALYTSLTTRYDLSFEDPGALVLPFPKVNPDDPDNRDKVDMGDRRTLLFRRGTDASLTGYSIRSNSTGMIHSEQMVDLGGALSLVETSGGRVQLANHTQLTLRDVGVVKKDDSDVLWTASLDRPLAPGATVPLRFSPFSKTSTGKPLWNPQQGGTLLKETPLKPLSGYKLVGQLRQLSLIEVAQDVGQLHPGEVRLVAWLDEQIAGLDVRPAAPQARFATLVVAHLKYPFGKDPQPDTNLLETGVRAGSETDVDAKELPDEDLYN